MQRIMLSSIVGILLITITALVWWLYPTPAPEVIASYPTAKQIKMAFSVRNASAQFIAEEEFWTYVPVSLNANQQRTNLKASTDYQLQQDPLGNAKMHLSIKNLPPYASRQVQITADLTMAKVPNQQTQTPALKQYLQAEKYIEVDHPKIQKAAHKLKHQDQLTTAKQLYDWQVRYMRDTGFTQRDRGALYALENRQGDCTEFAYFYTALARANNIPARPIAGFVAKNNQRLKARDYHNWAEIFVNNTWLIVDPFNRVFNADYENYVALQVLGQSADNENASSQQLYQAGKNLKVAML